MLSLKHNEDKLSIEDLKTIERYYKHWTNKSTMKSYNNEINVLSMNKLELYGHLLHMFEDFDIFNTLNTTPSQLLDFMLDVESRYNETPYHSFYHAADVVTVLYYLLNDLQAKQFLSSFEIALLLMAAMCHDAGHDGYNNDYHVKLQTPLAIRYKNISVLESLSVDITLELSQKHGLLTKEQDRTYLRHLILATDMANHYDLLEGATDLEDTMGAYHRFWQEDDEADDLMSGDDFSETLTSPFGFTTISPPSVNNNNNRNPMTLDNQLLLDSAQRLNLARILLHAADISNAVRSWSISKQWSDLVIQEFFRQGDAEKAAHLTVSPGMDRDLETQASISLKFIDFIVKPYFETITSLLPNSFVFLTNLEENRNEWQRLKASPLATSISNTSSPAWFRNNMSLAAGTIALQTHHHNDTKVTNQRGSTEPVPIRHSHHHHCDM